MPNISLKAISPKGLPKTKDFVQAIEKAVRNSAALTLRDLESTVKTWDTKVTFDVTITQSGNDYSVVAGTDSDVYKWVDSGTKPHTIKPKRSRYLRFLSGYRAKGRTGIIGSRAGGSYGDTVFSKGVNHPGFAGRRFTILIAKRRQKTIVQEIAQEIAKVTRG